MVSPGADDLVFSRAIAQLVLVDVIAPRRISVLIEGHRVPCNAWGGGPVGVIHSVSLLSTLPKDWEDCESRAETPLGRSLHGIFGEVSLLRNI